MKFFLLAIACMLLTVPLADANEYFVSVQGDDGHRGLSRTSAFRTIQRGVDALEAGDTLTILPGEYPETVHREGLGSAGADTRIQADLAGTVVLRGDVPAPKFVKEDGYRFVYSASFEQRPVTVLERGTPTALEERLNVTDLEFRPGSFYYDGQEQRLYISTSDMRPPEAHPLTVSVRSESGLRLDNARRVTIKGLVATGYYPADEKTHDFAGHVSGIMVNDSTACSIVQCVAFLNGNGITAVGGKQILIDTCRAYGNGTRRHAPSGNIVRFNCNEDVIRNCLSYASTSNGSGFQFYAGATGSMLYEGNIAFDNPNGDYWLKTVDREKYGMARNNVGLGDWAVGNIHHNLIGGRNAYNEEMPQSNVSLAGLNQEQEFADPANLDFRLQSTSSLRDSGPGGVDRGPYPYQANIYYVTESGDDGHDGLSIAGAWRTLGHAIEHLQSGDTLYLTEGTYRANVQLKRLRGEDERPIYIRGRGHGDVRIAGAVEVYESSNVVFERLVFLDAVKVLDSSSIAFRSSSFHQAKEAIRASDVVGFRAEHCLFSAGAVVLRNVADPVLMANVYNNSGFVAVDIGGNQAVRYSDYNRYAEPGSAWRLNAEVVSLEALPLNHDAYSQAGDVKLSDTASPTLVRSADALAGSSVGKPVGPYFTRTNRDARLGGASIFSVTDTTANIEWWTSGRMDCQVIWHDVEGEAHRKVLAADGYGAWSLTGLEPSSEYAVRIEAVNEYEELSFSTADKARDPRIYYVSPSGDDASSGRAMDDAWQTLNRAASEAGPGDTVVLDEGTYVETVWVRATGTSERPVTWKAAPGKKVVLDGAQRSLVNAFVATGKRHLRFDGIYFEGFGKDAVARQRGVFNLYRCRDVRISRCFMDGRGAGYNGVFVFALDTSELQLRNCVIARGFSGLQLIRCPDLRIEHSVFLNNMIAALICVNRPEEKIYLEHNIVTDSLPIKSAIQLFEIPYIDSFRQRENCFYLRLPIDERQNVVWFYQSAGKLTLAEMFDKLGRNGSVVGDPRFRGASGMEKEDKEEFLMDRFIHVRPMDFPDLFAMGEDVVEKKIGLNPEAFEDFHFNKTP